MTICLAKTLKVALLGCVIALGTARTADAAYVVINADPAFGSPFPSLGWRAIGAIYVPDTCLTNLPNAANSVVFQSLSNSPCAGIQMQDVKVGFYNLANPNVIIEELTIGSYLADIAPPPDQSNFLTQVLRDIDFGADKKVIGFSTSLSLAVRAFDPIAGGGSNYFALDFSSAGARLVAFGSSEPVYADRIGESIAPFNTIAANYTADGAYRAPTFATVPTGPGQVPEPGSLALVGLALAGLGLIARGRRAGA